MIRALYIGNMEVIRDEDTIFFEINKIVYHLGEFVVDGRIILKCTLKIRLKCVR
jgi:hypothetical protein